MEKAIESSTKQVMLKGDTSVEKGLFLPSKKEFGVYYAHPQTIAALKKNIDVFESAVDLVENIIFCKSCRKTLDPQFWDLCPYCQYPL